MARTCGPMTTRWVLPPILTPVNVRDVGGDDRRQFDTRRNTLNHRALAMSGV
jgi:hypothetical protein